MRLAVLISSYIIVALVSLVLIFAIGTTDAETLKYQLVGSILYLVPVVLSLIYAHGNRPKK